MRPPSESSVSGSRARAEILWLASVLCLGVAVVYVSRPRPDNPPLLTESTIPVDSQRAAHGEPAHHEVVINTPDGPPRLLTGKIDANGRPVSIACSTCHSIRETNPANRAASDLDEFHQGLTIAHGGLSCVSCHNSDDYDALRLADGRSLPFTEVMSLCAQCHGPQARDYAHGAHGGMTGHWDLTRGPRVRNNCIDCHDPHAPAFPTMQPTFKPRDRFLERPTHAEEGDHG